MDQSVTAIAPGPEFLNGNRVTVLQYGLSTAGSESMAFHAGKPAGLPTATAAASALCLTARDADHSVLVMLCAPSAARCKGVIHAQLEQYDTAALELNRMGVLPPEMVELWHAALVDPGQSERFVAYLSRAEVLAERLPALVGFMLTMVGEYDQAIEILDRGYEDRAWSVLFYLKTMPPVDPLRNHPQFISLLRRMGLE